MAGRWLPARCSSKTILDRPGILNSSSVAGQLSLVEKSQNGLDGLMNMLSPCVSSCRVHFALHRSGDGSRLTWGWDHGVVGSFGKEVAWPPDILLALRVCGLQSVTGAALVRTDECMVRRT